MSLDERRSKKTARLAALQSRPKLDRRIQDHLASHLSGLLKLPDTSPHLAAILARFEAALLGSKEPIDLWFKQGLLASAPHLRAYAVSLTSDLDRASDLVQETLLRALKYRDKFEAGSNLEAWLFTILRNLLYSQHRKRKREVEDADGAYALALSAPPEQPSKLEMRDLHAALVKLPPEQREAVLLVGAEGLSYEDAAAICGVAVGTIKSRVNRARNRLAELMGYIEQP